MKNYKRSICSTCRHAPHCSLTTDMSSISSCSEYVHHLDKDNEPMVMVSVETASDHLAYGRQANKNKELLIK
ncbi:hypothetical protein [Maribacter arenosus]|uniref:Uncharacterized protein n=1 Tax=Maribacter arenosus TaxID=1854708 RepID=A0ABR7VGZ1_9FLAO|nr:hypothetical protein [Maribacter arenosus]MBD0852211.1 hypothetical protein [Maribacter arenosus]